MQMSTAPNTAEIPKDTDQLEQLVVKLRGRVDYQESVIGTLHAEVALLKKRIFGKSSERFTEDESQLKLLFDEAEGTADESAEEPEEELEEITCKRRKKGGRKLIPAHIPREEVIHEIEDERKNCPHCGAVRPDLGFEDSEEIEYIPARVVVKKHRRRKYGPCGCRDFAEDESVPQVIVAPKPARLLPGSIASSSLLAYIIAGKFCDALPFYRQSQLLKRSDIDISRTNMANWTIKAAAKCERLIELMREKTREGPLINMDETRVQVIREPGRKAEDTSYMWVCVSSCSKGRIVLYNYARTRAAQIPLKLLKGFKGILQTDACSAYNEAAREYQLTHIGCLAHVRRKFMDAEGSGNSKDSLARTPLELFKKIYKVERNLRVRLRLKRITPDQFAALRRGGTKPYWKAFRRWLDDTAPMVPPSLPLGKAITYAQNEYTRVIKYLKYPQVTPDNNIAENAIRPFVVGRKNWLFCNTPSGAYASAVMYSLTETAKANGLNPQKYLQQVFEALPLIGEEDTESLKKLLPWNIAQ